MVLTLLVPNSFAQLCAPDDRNLDRQFITSDQRVLLLTTRFDGHLSNMMSQQPNMLWFNYVLITKEGKLIADSTLKIPFHGYHYNDYKECKASYSTIPKRYEWTTKECDCAMYEPFEVGEDVVIQYDLINDPRYSYIITIHPNGSAEFTEHDLLEYAGSYYNDFTKMQLTQHYHLDPKYPDRKPLLRPHVPVKDSTVLKLDRFTFIKDSAYIDHERTYRYFKHAYWNFEFEGSTIPLQGYLELECHPPLITLSEELLIVSVFNQDKMPCPYGPDTWPVVYAFDPKSGKLLWSIMFDSPVRSHF